MRFILAKLRELLLGHPMVDPDPARVRFTGYGDYSKNVEIFAYLSCQDQNTFLAIQEDILLRMEDIVIGAGSGFAFPSQTAYLAQDSGLDDQRVSEAVAEVEQWRAGGKLPFPEFADQQRAQIEDVLDYPPEGSPGYQPRADRPSTG
jgi:MscS family membrane protein